MFSKYFNRTSLVAFFLFIMVCLVVNHRTTYGQTPTPTATPPPATGGVIVGNVVDAVTTASIAGATISTDPGGFTTTTGADGSYALPVPAGDYTVTASATGYDSSSQPVTVVDGGATPANFSLQSTTTGGNGIIFGFVNDEEDNALEGVTVTLDGVEHSESVGTDEEGFYQFGNLLAGDYTLTCEKDGFQTYTEGISLLDGEIREIGTITLETVIKAKISGYALNIKGVPVENAKIRAKGISTGYINTSFTDADGFFEFVDLEADTFVLVANKRGYKRARQTVTLEEGEETEIEIEMKRTSKRIMKESVR